MRTKVFVEQPARKYQTVHKHCDVCKRDLTHAGGGQGECSEVKIEALVGDRWPEGDFRVRYSIDLCAECFEKRKKKIEEAVDVKFQETEAEDW